MDEATLQRLKEARRRLRLRRFVHLYAWSLAGALGLLALWQGLRLVTWIPAVGIELPFLLLGPLLVAVLGAAFSWRPPLAVARALDRAAASRDRFVTSLTLDASLPLAGSIREEIAVFSRAFRVPASLGPRRPDRALLATALAALAWGGLIAWDAHRRSRLAPDVEAAQATLARAAEAVRREEPHDPKLAEARKELEDARRRLADSQDPRRDAFRALANLERSLSANPSGRALTPQEAAAVADALAPKNARAGQALQDGPSSENAQALSELDPAALAQALQQAAKHLQSTRLRELAEQSAANAQTQLVRSYQPGSGEGARRRLSQALREMKSQPSQGNGQNQNQMAGISPDSPNGKEPGQSARSDNAPPGGAPGSEHDLGRGEDIHGEKDPSTSEAGQQDRIAGAQGAGPAAVSIFQSSGADQAKAARPNQDPTTAAVAAALETVEQEDIPPGSRLLVKRYFEAIRPKE